ncbi:MULTISPECIES: HAD domain-containing protein [Okeania]|uniref:FCP1 homology domain-containing protein n=1 Tax=Okeania hirsuta TaxID=1458930 RepID=A0A3N6PH33_9CYAN|nr:MULTISPECIES: HAD domain-containing protein [Okeania]NES75772.1 hypothetical protein [Okeania sp. SIO1H4]NET19954.1 hypothetical protein [Okeania sp. SIO1H5]NET75463.1 hypothetical protein [Okeania sp. SIO1F9]NET91788.1 hypothetical protein [Okeania sp. SIO1H2]RQH14343.1 hypothetical protein D4Z78_23150 [Okeania hirsuta]
MWIFLDIDGVLVPEKNFDSPIYKENDLQFDPIFLSLFEDIVQLYPGVLVVISSSWRELFSFEFVRSLFSPDFREKVVGFTPFLDPEIIHQFEYIRHQEVVKFLRNNNCLGYSWVAIDDIPEHYPPDTHIVITDAYNGFDASAALALELYLLSAS